jgi:hypothetical protein
MRSREPLHTFIKSIARLTIHSGEEFTNAPSVDPPRKRHGFQNMRQIRREVDSVACADVIEKRPYAGLISDTDKALSAFIPNGKRENSPQSGGALGPPPRVRCKHQLGVSADSLIWR